MSSIVISGDISGTVTLDAPAVSGTTVLTLPATSGTVLTQNPSAPADSLVVNASGNVGIGTTSPAQLLEVKKDQAGSTRIKVTNKTNNSASTAGLLFENSTSDVAVVQLWDSGTIGALTAFGLNMEGTGSGGVNLAASNASGVIRFATGGTTERMRIDSSGNVLVGTTSETNTGLVTIKQKSDNDAGGLRLIAPNSSNAWAPRTGSDNFFYFGYNGTSRASINSSTGAYSALSDSRLKENIEQIDKGLDVINQLNPVKYNMIDDESKAIQIGFIAQEVEPLITEVVNKPSSANEYYGLNYAGLTPILVKAIQEQQTIINDLKARIETLENK